jgi:hypothetical protein
MPYTQDQLIEARDRAEAWLNEQSGIRGTGIGLSQGGQACIKIFTDHMPPETKQLIEHRLANLPIEFEESGEFIAF